MIDGGMVPVRPVEVIEVPHAVVIDMTPAEFRLFGNIMRRPSPRDTNASVRVSEVRASGTYQLRTRWATPTITDMA